MITDKRISTRRIIRNFSRAVGTYDHDADVQKETARLLLECARAQPRRIYEIGCGTGLYTAMLRETFPNARISAADASWDMVAAARRAVHGVSFFVAVAERPAVQSGFDLVTANAVLQWADMDRTLEMATETLCPGGQFTCAVFGPRTYEELDSAARKHGLGPIAARGFMTLEQIESKLSCFFRRVTVREEIMHRVFDSFGEMMSRMKNTGSCGLGSARRGLCTRRILERVNRSYLDEFNQIRATYQVFVCAAQKP